MKSKLYLYLVWNYPAKPVKNHILKISSNRWSIYTLSKCLNCLAMCVFQVFSGGILIVHEPLSTGKLGSTVQGTFSSKVCIRHRRTKSTICSQCGEAPDVKLLASTAGGAVPPACAAVGHLVPVLSSLAPPLTSFVLSASTSYPPWDAYCTVLLVTMLTAKSNWTIAWPRAAEGLLVFLDWPPCLVPFGRRSSTFLGL